MIKISFIKVPGNMGRKIPFLCLLICTNIIILHAAEENISLFNDKFALNFSGIYTISGFSQDKMWYNADKPWALGLGIRIKNISLGLSFPIYSFDINPFYSFDFQTNSYYDAVYYKAFCRRYQGFTYGEEPEKIKIDLTLFSAGISAGWIQNNKNHSLSAIYDLDKMQITSSGSFLYGFGVTYTSIYCEDSTIENYAERQHFIYFGPAAGYSYTWIFPQNIFLNMNLVIGLNAGNNINENKWLIVPQLMPNISVGHHDKAWSINFAGSCDYTNIIWDNTDFDTLLAGTMAVTFSKRF
jgi:hypothetical protein